MLLLLLDLMLFLLMLELVVHLLGSLLGSKLLKLLGWGQIFGHLGSRGKVVVWRLELP